MLRRHHRTVPEQQARHQPSEGGHRFSECEWRPPAALYDQEEIHLSIFTAIEELRRRLMVLINRWLIPASVYTFSGFRHFVVEKMLSEDLLESPEDAYKVFVAPDTFNLVHVASGNMLDLVIGSEEYNTRYLLLLALVDPVLAAVSDLLTAETTRFLQRTVTAATPPESGILETSGSPYVIPILYGRFSNVVPSVQTWEISHRHREFTLDGSSAVFNGIVRLVLAYFRHTAHQRRQDGLHVPAGTAAALLFTEQLSERFTDVTTAGFLYTAGAVEGVTMHRDSDALVAMLAEMLAVDKTFVAQQLLTCNALSPSSATGFVNVAFVVENILFALQHETLRLPVRFTSDYTRTRAKFWVMARTRLRRALALAFDSPAGVSARKLKSFAQACGTSGKVFTHLFRCFHVLTQGVMTGQAYGRREIGLLERGMTDISTAEDTMKARGVFPSTGPWKKAVTYSEDGDDVTLCLANLVEDLAAAVQDGALTRKRWEPKAGLFMQSGLPGKEWEYSKTEYLPDPGTSGVWRVLNAFINIKALNAGAEVPKTPFQNTDASQEVLKLAFAATVPSMVHLVNGMCYSRETREMSPCMLPVYVLLWNTAMVLRRRLRETAAAVPVTEVLPSHQLRRRKRQRVEEEEAQAEAEAQAQGALPVPTLCMVCMETPSAKLMDCSHGLCVECASALLEGRAVDLFSGRGGGLPAQVYCCPDRGCTGRLQEAAFLSLVPPEVHAMVLFASSKSTEGETVYCSMCGAGAPASFIRDIDGAVFTCSACGVKTCAQCERAAHPGDACVKRMQGLPSPEDLLSQAKIQHCPKCAVPEVKHRNCNHVFCKMCNTDWCWACGVALESNDISNHYKDSPECVLYSTETETERMRVAISAKSTPETAEIVACALKLLCSSSLQQMESDI